MTEVEQELSQLLSCAPAPHRILATHQDDRPTAQVACPCSTKNNCDVDSAVWLEFEVCIELELWKQMITHNYVPNMVMAPEAKRAVSI